MQIIARKSVFNNALDGQSRVYCKIDACDTLGWERNVANVNPITKLNLMFNFLELAPGKKAKRALQTHRASETWYSLERAGE